MSLTSYRAAPPRVNRMRRERRMANREQRRWRYAALCSPLSRPVCRPFVVLQQVKRRISYVLRRPGDDLLSQVLRHSTIGAEAFDGRVRDGIGSYRYAESHQAGEARKKKQTGFGLSRHCLRIRLSEKSSTFRAHAKSSHLPEGRCGEMSID